MTMYGPAYKNDVVNSRYKIERNLEIIVVFSRMNNLLNGPMP